MVEDESLLEIVSGLQKELDKIHLEFQDEDVDQALALVVKIIAKPDIPPGSAARLVVLTQALSSKFALVAKYYMLYPTDDITKEERSRKKNSLMTLSAEFEKLSNALKYLVRL